MTSRSSTSATKSVSRSLWLYLAYYLEGAGKLLRQHCSSQDPEKYLQAPRRHHTMSRGKIWFGRDCGHRTVWLREYLGDGEEALFG